MPRASCWFPFETNPNRAASKENTHTHTDSNSWTYSARSVPHIRSHDQLRELKAPVDAFSRRDCFSWGLPNYTCSWAVQKNGRRKICPRLKPHAPWWACVLFGPPFSGLYIKGATSFRGPPSSTHQTFPSQPTQKPQPPPKKK